MAKVVCHRRRVQMSVQLPQLMSFVLGYQNVSLTNFDYRAVEVPHFAKRLMLFDHCYFK